jgi:chemosensory pili system protein ChpA (sensor histidine kinase/response regulator)
VDSSNVPLVLVVEDDSQLRQLYRTALRAGGYAVVAVGDGVDALRQIEQRVPAAVVLDLGLPFLGGHDLHRELLAHSDTRKIPVVVVTGDTRSIDASAFACVLRKPINPDELLAAVRDCLRKHRPGAAS